MTDLNEALVKAAVAVANRIEHGAPVTGEALDLIRLARETTKPTPRKIGYHEKGDE